MEDIQKRRLVIRAFHATDVQFGEKPSFVQGVLTVPQETHNQSDLVVKSTVSILKPHEHDVEVNSIMDIIPMSTKVLGKLGDGVTHTFTGCYVLLTGVDEDGRQIGEFDPAKVICKSSSTSVDAERPEKTTSSFTSTSWSKAANPLAANLRMQPSK